MPGEIHRIRTYLFRNTDHLFFDANIWIFLYGGQYNSNDSPIRIYSAAFKQILAANSRIFIDVLVLSEVVNRMARFAYLSDSTRPKDFKAYRNSSRFRPVSKNIADTCRRILGHASRIESGFSSINIEAALSDYEKGHRDCNDLVLAELCRAKGLSFVTDDGDFRGRTIKIITENSRLLKAT